MGRPYRWAQVVFTLLGSRFCWEPRFRASRSRSAEETGQGRAEAQNWHFHPARSHEVTLASSLRLRGLTVLPANKEEGRRTV